MTLAFLIVALCCFLYALYRFYLVYVYVNKLNKVPGPPANPIFGNALQFNRKQDLFFRQLREYGHQYPTGYRLFGGWHGTVNIFDPDDIEIIVSNMKYMEKSNVYEFLKPWLQTGLLTSKGSKWQQRRKILTPAFHFNILRRFVDIISEHTERFIEELRQECHNKETNIIPLICNLTLNTICETAMGTSIDQRSKKQADYSQALYRLSLLVVERIIRPWFYSDWMFALFPLGRLHNKYLNTLHKFTKEVIEERERTFNVEDVEQLEAIYDGFSKKKRLAMLDLLISAKQIDKTIDDEGIREEVDTFMFEGHDTVSMALCYAIMLLANHNDIQEKIVSELREIFGTSKRASTFDDLQNMKYLEMCIKESLRLYPSVYFIARHIHEDVQLKNFVVPANTAIHIHIFDLHRNPQIYPDPEKFDPDRFLPENTQGRHPYAYIPFSAGPRNCIGQKFAILEMKSILSSLLWNYTLLPVDKPEDLKLKIDIILRTIGNIHIKLKPRLY